MPNITSNVSFNHCAREWRCKWAEDNEKKNLVGAQDALDKALTELKAIKGVKDVQRIVCGSCHDFKVITTLDGGSFGDWEKAEFAPEKTFLKALEDAGCSTIETQTFTIESML
mmetsp:Transcript_13805/g.19674  ORF Transcript_13805/g.19674 Transcript_13805/m.19674 type:complete len:113 (-) Transcript_13805:68-406(-)|eukprot:CAMPEP_0175102322 /NCGR_PEP_ID=MMETSP0086_2-20121207/8366_1 /TAXON_ID=136419 /ORGANISM="Unknown Unknown, Strain D1" /LENGTH=112 /DNA_ID=CAMNT_0016377107 /DNA_START=119 /DNA_END=457 /DNA_ORIENTATION=+